MKIAYYIDTVIPTKRANMVHVMKMCQAFSDLGHSVTLFCDSSEEVIDLDTVREKYAVTNQFAIKTAYIPHILRKYGHRLAAYYGAYRKSRFCLDYDCAYSRSAATLFFIRKHIRYVYEAHMEPDLINRNIEKNILFHKNCIGLVVISAALKQRYLELFPSFPQEKITVLHDGADTVTTDPADQAVLCAEQGELKIGYIGHLYPGKCMETLLPLASRCTQRKFHIVGGTEEWVEKWKNEAEAQSLANLIFYGYVDNCLVGNYYRVFDLIILPFSQRVNIGKNAKNDIGKWISPLKLFEAMAYGKPILVSRLATIEEVMADGEDCVMVEPDNIEDWVKKLDALCEDTEMQRRIGQAAREKLEREYTWLERARKAASLFD